MEKGREGEEKDGEEGVLDTSHNFDNPPNRLFVYQLVFPPALPLLLSLGARSLQLLFLSLRRCTARQVEKQARGNI